MTDNVLRIKLKELRTGLIKKLNMHLRDIYTDETIDAIVKYKPQSLEKLLRIRCIREVKWIYFADDILRVIHENEDELGKCHEPIASLSIDQKFWVIKAKVAFKSDVYRWSNSQQGRRGGGQYFKLKLCDCSSSPTTINSTAFDIVVSFYDKAVDEFHKLIKEDHVYTFSGGRLKCTSPLGYKDWKRPLEIIFDDKTMINTKIVCRESKKNHGRRKVIDNVGKLLQNGGYYTYAYSNQLGEMKGEE